MTGISQMLTRWAVMCAGLSALCITLPLSGEDGAKQSVQVTNTQWVNFAPGGTIRVNDSFDYLNVEGWDQPEVEITVIKSTERRYESPEREQAARRLEQ